MHRLLSARMPPCQAAATEPFEQVLLQQIVSVRDDASVCNALRERQAKADLKNSL